MDLNTSNYTEVVGRGERLELLHPGTGRSFSAYGGNALFVRVLGIDAEPVEAAKREAGRTLMKAARGPTDRSVVQYEINIACAAVVEFEGGAGEVATLADFKKFLQTHPDGKFYARQVLQFAENSANFFAEPQSV